jgi:hypothetical protein
MIRPTTKNQSQVADSSSNAVLSRLDKIEALLVSLTKSSAAEIPSPTVTLAADINLESHRQLPPVLQKLTEEAFSINRSLCSNNVRKIKSLMFS